MSTPPVTKDRVASSTKETPALTVEGLTIRYGMAAAAVTDVDLRVGHGEVVGVVGESGCGKSSVALALLGLLPPSGDVSARRLEVADHDMLGLDEARATQVRGKDASMVFQEPMTALNPCMRVGAQIAEVLLLHGLASRKEARGRALELLELVGVPDPQLRLKQFPHQLSGGLRQRVVIAIAIAASPRLLIADEPTTALDVTIQAQILELLDELRHRTGMGMLLISHDLGVIAQTCDRVVVMYAGQVVEEGVPAQVLSAPGHPYTAALIDSIPRLTTGARKALPAIRGAIADSDRERTGCRFAPRCPLASPECEAPQTLQPLRDAPNRRVRCVLATHPTAARNGALS